MNKESQLADKIFDALNWVQPLPQIRSGLEALLDHEKDEEDLADKICAYLAVDDDSEKKEILDLLYKS